MTIQGISHFDLVGIQNDLKALSQEFKQDNQELIADYLIDHAQDIAIANRDFGAIDTSAFLVRVIKDPQRDFEDHSKWASPWEKSSGPEEFPNKVLSQELIEKVWFKVRQAAEIVDDQIVAEELREKFGAGDPWLAIAQIVKLSGFDGAHHKDYAMDQAVRAAFGPKYEEFVKYVEGEDEYGDPEYPWSIGIAP